MKRVCAFVVVILMLVTTSIGLCDDDEWKEFNCTLTSMVAPDTAIEILLSEKQRAIVTVCLLLDFGISDAGEGFVKDNFFSLLLNDSYVSSDGSFIAVSGYAGDQILLLGYNPLTKVANYHLMDSSLPDTLKSNIIKKTAEEQRFAYKNEPTLLYEAFEIIGKALSDN